MRNFSTNFNREGTFIGCTACVGRSGSKDGIDSKSLKKKRRRVLNQIRRFKFKVERTLVPTNDFGLVNARLENARRYVLADEFGAASFELKLLSGLLAHYA